MYSIPEIKSTVGSTGACYLTIGVTVLTSDLKALESEGYNVKHTYDGGVEITKKSSGMKALQEVSWGGVTWQYVQTPAGGWAYRLSDPSRKSGFCPWKMYVATPPIARCVEVEVKGPFPKFLKG